MGEEFLLPLVFSSGNVILLKRPDGGMADTRDLKSVGCIAAPGQKLPQINLF